MKTWIYTREDADHPQPQVILFPSHEAMITRFISDLIRDGREVGKGDQPTVEALKATRDADTPLADVFEHAQLLYESILDDMGGHPFYHLDDKAGTEVPDGRDETPDASDAMYRTTAKDLYHKGGEIEVQDDAPVSIGEDGAYVQAWVFVPHPPN